jgi:hypothetical protein
MIKESSIPHEYYLGDFPGTLQYNKEPQEIIDCQLPEDDNNRGFSLCEHSLENLRRITPSTQKNVDWKILLMMIKEENDEFWMKAALLNKATGKVALLTATNDKNNLEKRGHRAVKTVDGNWFVGHFRCPAPIVFWKELKNRLLY